MFFWFRSVFYKNLFWGNKNVYKVLVVKIFRVVMVESLWYRKDKEYILLILGDWLNVRIYL